MIKVRTLDNGLCVVGEENSFVRSVAMGIWIKNGSVDEDGHNTGISHFIEHMMFKGTKKIPSGKFSNIIAENGGRENAFTNQDYTAYFQRIAADRLELMMRMEADRMVNLQLSEGLRVRG